MNMAESSELLWQAIYRAKTGRATGTSGDLIWANETRNNDMPTPHYDKTLARDRMADKLYAVRDPCPKCGTRKDIGCRHEKGG